MQRSDYQTRPNRLADLDAIHRKCGNIINTLKGKTAFVAKAISQPDVIDEINLLQGAGQPIII